MIGVLRVRLLVSAARIALSIAILSVTVLGEPPEAVRLAMQGAPSPGGGATAVPTPEPYPTADTPTPPPPTRVPAEGPPTWIEAPSIGLDAPVVEVGYRITYVDGLEATEWQVPDRAAGFHQGSAYPGHPGNTVISGHHNIGSEVFRDLINLNVGDEIILWVDKTSYRYKVAQKEILLEAGVSDAVRRKNGRWIAPTDDERLTLVTCWPYTGNSHRLIIVARPVP